MCVYMCIFIYIYTFCCKQNHNVLFHSQQFATGRLSFESYIDQLLAMDNLDIAIFTYIYIYIYVCLYIYIYIKIHSCNTFDLFE